MEEATYIYEEINHNFSVKMLAVIVIGEGENEVA
jgi:hypothetical protein